MSIARDKFPGRKFKNDQLQRLYYRDVNLRPLHVNDIFITRKSQNHNDAIVLLCYLKTFLIGILSYFLPLIQEGQLSVTGESMCT